MSRLDKQRENYCKMKEMESLEQRNSSLDKRRQKYN